MMAACHCPRAVLVPTTGGRHHDRRPSGRGSTVSPLADSAAMIGIAAENSIIFGPISADLMECPKRRVTVVAVGGQGHSKIVAKKNT